MEITRAGDVARSGKRENKAISDKKKGDPDLPGSPYFATTLERKCGFDLDQSRGGIAAQE
jgi:hypothetical protein